MLQKMRGFRGWTAGENSTDDNNEFAEFKALRLLTAQILFLTGTQVALENLQRSRSEEGPPFPHGSPGPERRIFDLVASWAPAVVAPLAGAAHLSQAMRPHEGTSSTARALSFAAVGAGVTGLIDTWVEARRTRTRPSLAPLALASAGLLGLIVEREEQDVHKERQRLQRRSSLAERLVPRRRGKLDRIVVHV